MAFDKTAWDPTPSQYTLIGVCVSWTLAVTAQTFLLGKDTAWTTLKRLVALPLNGQFNMDLWNPLLLWVVIPSAALYLALLFGKPYRKKILGAGTVLLTLILTFGDLGLRIFEP